MKYYTEKKMIARVDKNDTVLGKVERWEAHKEGILHRALTVTVRLGDHILLQHRKHPVFDGVLDMTVSTHQIFEKDILSSDIDTVYETLSRELTLTREDIVDKPKHEGSIIYRAPDPKSTYVEHEVCHIYTCEVRRMPVYNPSFAYDVFPVGLDEIKDTKSKYHERLAPWVKEMIESGMV